ncbi:hypothetical protein [Amycolatopsis jiangsuensis]|uniref:Uncharacterized protein n=1 Tax=Amycolatopsis jiangsuensis TaxID=1181879 RepID=A0A840IPC4_9PSEU|nr:hypothetical protein [Amycolatopsis jiangsuensis]MBB4683409.1 hypothetical protein [Amycolatopsis jiangsuensis]
MAGTEPGGAGDLESVAKLVRMSETAPMPRIDAAEPTRVQRRQQAADGTPALSGAFGGALDDASGSAAGQLAAAGGPVTEELASLDDLLDGSAPGDTARGGTAPPPDWRPARYLIVAGAAVVVLGGLGTWALWPAPSGGTAGQPVGPPPAAPSSSTSAAPSAVTTLTGGPTTTPAPATDEVRDTTVRATSKEDAPRQTRRRPATSAPRDPAGEFGSAVSSYLQQWSERGYPPHRWQR